MYQCIHYQQFNIFLFKKLLYPTIYQLQGGNNDILSMQMLKIFLSHPPFVRKSLDDILYHTSKLTKKKSWNQEMGRSTKRGKGYPGDSKRRSRIIALQCVCRRTASSDWCRRLGLQMGSLLEKKEINLMLHVPIGRRIKFLLENLQKGFQSRWWSR